MKFVWFCAAGYSFFLGVGIIILAIILQIFCKKLWCNIIIQTSIIIGVFLIFLSATPLPCWFYIIWAAAVFSWFVIARLRIIKYYRLMFLTALCLSITALILEFPFHLIPSLPRASFEKLYVIGDSVSAGIAGKEEQTWPKILRKEHGINVIDLSVPGATVSLAKRQADLVDSEDAIVLLEIGGNDIFTGTPGDIFEADLKQILEKINNPKRIVIMLELPLQPWHIKYGRIQRRLAKQFDVILIPKRFFVSILAAKDVTVDLAHLSKTGHELMADKIWSLIRNSISPSAREERN